MNASGPRARPRSFDDIYSLFEDRFRGDRETIRERQQAYLSFLDLAGASSAAPRRALDLGSGRGEWLGIVAEHGWSGIGVDSNPSMVEAARRAGIDTVATDALSYLRSCEDGSFDLVSAFHVVEHVPIDVLVELLSETHRVLAQGGLLLLETPNPENLVVSGFSFAIDPTHNRPLPPHLLQFLVESTGFPQAEILRLHSDRLHTESTSLTALFTASLDYAIVAIKAEKGNELADALRSLVSARSEQAPLDVAGIVSQVGAYEQYRPRLDAMEAAIEPMGQALSTHASWVDGQLTNLKARSEELRWEMLALNAAFDTRLANELERRLNEVYASHSWKLTKPYRFAGRLLKRVMEPSRTRASAPPSLGREALQSGMRRIFLGVMARPALRGFIARSFQRVPVIDRALRRHFARLGALPPPPGETGTTAEGPVGLFDRTTDFSQASPPRMSARAALIAGRIRSIALQDQGAKTP